MRAGDFPLPRAPGTGLDHAIQRIHPKRGKAATACSSGARFGEIPPIWVSEGGLEPGNAGNFPNSGKFPWAEHNGRRPQAPGISRSAPLPGTGGPGLGRGAREGQAFPGSADREPASCCRTGLSRGGHESLPAAAFRAGRSPAGHALRCPRIPGRQNIRRSARPAGAGGCHRCGCRSGDLRAPAVTAARRPVVPLHGTRGFRDGLEGLIMPGCVPEEPG